MRSRKDSVCRHNKKLHGSDSESFDGCMQSRGQHPPRRVNIVICRCDGRVGKQNSRMRGELDKDTESR